jgi:hypothetical protein
VSTEDPIDPEARAEEISDEIARKYDPKRLLAMVAKRAGRGEALDHSIRAKYEKRFGVDLGHVRIYTGEFAEEFNRRRDAYAVTIGATGMILMGGSPDKAIGSRAGQALLAHELTHVAQAAQARGGASHGLNRSATFDGGFAEEHEEGAREVEAHELDASTRAAADAGSSKLKAEEEREEMLRQVCERVLELMAEAERTVRQLGELPRRA